MRRLGLIIFAFTILMGRATRADNTLKWAQGIEGQRMADLGDGTYRNPIVSGDHP